MPLICPYNSAKFLFHNFNNVVAMLHPSIKGVPRGAYPEINFQKSISSKRMHLGVWYSYVIQFFRIPRLITEIARNKIQIVPFKIM